MLDKAFKALCKVQPLQNKTAGIQTKFGESGNSRCYNLGISIVFFLNMSLIKYINYRYIVIYSLIKNLLTQ